MKKTILLLSLIFLPFTPVTGATTLTLCIPLNQNSSCTSGYIPSLALDWSASCTTNNTTIQVRGVSVCSSYYGGLSYVNNSKIIQNAPDDGSNKYCYCKTTSPIRSTGWAYAREFSDTMACYTNCAISCGAHIANTGSYLKDPVFFTW